MMSFVPSRMSAAGTRSLALILLTGLLLGLSAAALPTAAQAQVDVFEFETDEQERRFQQLSREFRCPMCQNTNLADSPGGVAQDLRREIYNMIMDGYSDQEIEQFMEQRYGEFIFYRPRLQLSTVMLWFGPLLFFAIGAVVIFTIARRNREKKAQTDLSPEEKERLDRLLAEKRK